jgi:hypothetical protein
MGTDINFKNHLGRTYGTRIGLPAFDPAAQAYFAATGITGATQQAAIDNLVKGLKADGIWSKMKAVYPFATDNRNLLSYTTTFINSNYNTDNTATFTLNNTTAPDGTNTGVRFTAVGSNNNYFYSANTVGGNNFGAGNKAFSIYVKAGTFSGSVSIGITSDGSNSASVIALTNDWQRITVTKNVIVAGNNSQYFIDMNSTTMTSGQYFYIWAPQFENGTTATTYQPIATTQQAYIANQFKYNLKDPRDLDAAFRLVFNGGWTHSSNGATPNGVNGYADTKLTPSSVLTLNSNHISYYSRTNANSGIDMGVQSDDVSGRTLYMAARNSLGNLAASITTLDANRVISSNADSTGFYVVSRISDTSLKSYKNSLLQATNTNAGISSQANAVLAIGCLAYKQNTFPVTFINYSTKQVAFTSMGDGLTDTEAANLYTRVQAYQTALSRQV